MVGPCHMSTFSGGPAAPPPAADGAEVALGARVGAAAALVGARLMPEVGAAFVPDVGAPPGDAAEAQAARTDVIAPPERANATRLKSLRRVTCSGVDIGSGSSFYRSLREYLREVTFIVC